MILAKVTGKTPGEIVLNLGDTHVYESHIEQVKEQLTRKPCKFPKLEIMKELNSIEDIESLKYTDFKLIDYHAHPTIKADMAV